MTGSCLKQWVCIQNDGVALGMGLCSKQWTHVRWAHIQNNALVLGMTGHAQNDGLAFGMTGLCSKKLAHI